MARTFINQLADGVSIDEIYLASEKQLRPNRQGNLYLQLRLSDKTGTLTSMKWNASQSDFDAFENGNYVRVRGNAQLFNGNMQVIARDISPAREADVHEEDFVTVSQESIEQYADRLAELLRSVSDPDLANLAESILADHELMSRFKKAPAGIRNHHAYQGGLLQHVVSLLELAQFVGQHYRRLNTELLVMGAFLHDIGKIDELAYDKDLAYEDAGQLIGHMVMGVEILQRKIDDVERQTGNAFPVELTMQLKHLILSHHGQLEYGSPVLPMTLEAMALHFIDNLDAKMHGVTQIIDEDANPASAWTTFQPSLSRKIYKGLPSNPVR